MKTELSLVDQLGTIKAQIAGLVKQEKDLIEAIKRQILARDGEDNGIDGVLFRAVLTCTIRESIDVKRLQAERPDIAAEFKQSTAVEALRVVARKA